ncbi:MAG: IS701 family transposase [Planctomycetota bacterium]|jgi:hypothetical protein
MDAALVTAWKAICQALAEGFTRPTFATFLHIVTGWVLCRSKPTVTSIICTIGGTLLGHSAKHWTVYERFFYRAQWSLDTLSRLLLTRVVVPVVDAHGVAGAGAPVELIFDETTCDRTGRHVAYAGYFKDASVTNTLKRVFHWSHQWVIGAVVLRPARWPHWAIALPVFFALYRKKPHCDGQHPYTTVPQLAADMIRQAQLALPDRQIRVAADGQYACGGMADAMEVRTTLVSRLRRDAVLYDLLPARRRRGAGRPRKRGRRLPTPQQIAARRYRGWKTIHVRKGGRVVRRRVLSLVCLWYRALGQRPIKVVIVRQTGRQADDDFLFCTNPPIEEAILDGKQQGGFEQVQGWCPRTVQRQAPVALIVQTLVKTWYVSQGVKARWAQPRGPTLCGWLRNKPHPSYLDMLATLRQALWDDRINSKSMRRSVAGKTLRALRFTLCAAA